MEVTFTVTDKNAAESEYKLSIDAIRFQRVPIGLNLTAGQWQNGELEIQVDTAILTGSREDVLLWTAGEQDAAYFADDGTRVRDGAFTVTQPGVYTVYAASPYGDWDIRTIQVEPPQPEFLRGDLDGDRQVTIMDVMEACKILARKSAGTDPAADEVAIGDLDGDSKITIADVMEICKIIARKS